MGAFPHIRYAAKSDIGRKRTNNEDSFGAFPESGIFCVADGMGGGDDGEVASAATVKAIERFTKECPLPAKYTYPIEGIVSGVRAAINSASAWIAKRTQQKGLKGCGSTFVGICFDAAKPNTAIALHAGDSRLYRIRGRSIEQITTDHSAAELIGAKDDKDVNPMFRGMILRAVGIQPAVELERTEVSLKVGDRILICSDGLSRMVDDKKLLSIVRSGKELQTTVEKLIATANSAGGIDNITVELIEVGEFPDPLPTSPLANQNEVGDTSESGNDLEKEATTNKTEDANVPSVASTEDDFIPSTAGDDAGEPKEEALNIPESDTEDDLAQNQPPKAEEAATPISAASLKRKIVVFKLMTNWIFLSGAVLLLIILCSIAACVWTRASEEAEVKSAAETKIHRKEQKDSLQTVEARRRAELEQQSRAAEELKTRSEIQTHEKQKELEEKARKAAERRAREEQAAREKAEADAQREKEAKAQEAARQEELRKAEEARKLKEEAEAKERARKEAEELARKERERKEAQAEAERKEKERIAREEAARQEELRKAEEARKLKEEAEAKERARKEAEELARKERERKEAAARAEAERKEKERLAREEAERQEQLRKAEEERKRKEAEAAKALAEKQERERKAKEAREKENQRFSAFETVAKDGTAGKFHAKIAERIPNAVPEVLHQKLSQAGNAKLARTDRVAAIVALTKDVQQVSRALMEYSAFTQENIKSDLADPMIEKSTKDFLTRVWDGITAFDREAKDFVSRDAAEPDTQVKCVHIIRSVPKWFAY